MSAWIVMGILLGLAIIVWIVLNRATEKMFTQLCCRPKRPDRIEEHFFEDLEADGLGEWIEPIRANRKWMAEFPYEEIFIQSEDGLRLHSRFYESPAWNGRVLILCHGFHSNPEHDFSGAVRFYHELGYHLLVIDQRAHGKSEGTYICFGAKERYDVRAWCAYAAQRFGQEVPVLLSGISMGSTTVLLTAGLPEPPPNVCAVIADCGYANIYEEFRHVLKQQFHLPAFPLLNIADGFCKRRSGFSIHEFDTAEVVRNIRVPVMFVHGEGDNFVPAESTRRNFAACTARKVLLLVPGAGHGLSWLVQNEAYKKMLTEFLASL